MLLIKCKSIRKLSPRIAILIHQYSIFFLSHFQQSVSMNAFFIIITFFFSTLSTSIFISFKFAPHFYVTFFDSFHQDVEGIQQDNDFGVNLILLIIGIHFLLTFVWYLFISTTKLIYSPKFLPKQWTLYLFVSYFIIKWQSYFDPLCTNTGIYQATDFL